MVSVPDASHTRFGWWKKVVPDHATDDDDTTEELEFSTFSKLVPANQTPPTGFISLNGPYEYKGRAAGQYALHSPALQNSATGEFTANVSLTAIFNGDDSGVGTISGDITGISGQPDWSLELVEGPMATTGTIGQSTMGVEWTIKGFSEKGGSWGGRFSFDQEKLGALPSAAVGTFTGDYGGDGRIIGAFGARKQ